MREKSSWDEKSVAGDTWAEQDIVCLCLSYPLQIIIEKCYDEGF